MAAPFKGSHVPAMVDVPVKPQRSGETQMFNLASQAGSSKG
jgi:hypothetical protein